MKRIKIGIDGRPLQGNITGIGRYISELCKELDKILPCAQFYIYSQYPVIMPVISDRWVNRIDPLPVKKYFKSIIWLKLRCGVLCKEDDLDLFWAAATLFPKLNPKVKKVSTVYDLNYYLVPKTMPRWTYWGHKLFFRKDVEKADTVLTISEGTSLRLYEFIGRKADATIIPAVGSSFSPRPEEEVKEVLEAINIHTPFILALSTWEPRKNLETLLMAFSKMKREGLIPDHKLVLAGGKGWKDKKLANLVNYLQNSDSIHPLGYVKDEHLPAIFTGADVFVFPSIYEGFGIPVLEARACGTSVVTTDIPELKEAGGNDAIYTAPTEDGIRNGILTALKLPKRCALKSDLPTWRTSAITLAQTFIGQTH